MKSFIQNYEAIIYINRDQDVSRNKAFLERWTPFGIPIHRISSITPKNTDIVGVLNSNRDLKDGLKCRIRGIIDKQKIAEASCSMSHALALSKGRNLGLTKFIILEDDAQPTDYLCQDIIKPDDNTFITYLNYLAFTQNCGTKLTADGYEIKAYAKNDDWAITEGGIFSTSAYAVNINCVSYEQYDRIINDLVSGVIADYYFSEFLQRDFKCIIPKRKLVSCDTNFKTTIGDNYKGINEAYNQNVHQRGYVYGTSEYGINTPLYLPKNGESRAYLTLKYNENNVSYYTNEELPFKDYSDCPKVLLGEYCKEFVEEVFITSFSETSYKKKLEIEYSEKENSKLFGKNIKAEDIIVFNIFEQLNQ